MSLRFRPLPGPAGPRRQPPAQAGAHLPILGLACTLAPGQAAPVTGAVLTRVLAGRCPPGTVILDLGMASDLDPGCCEALHGLLDRLAGCGIRSRLVSGSATVRAQLADAGLADRLGPGGVQPSLRAAVLAVYAALPGAGLVTPEIRAALTAPAEPVGPDSPAGEPAALTPVTAADAAVTRPGRLAPPEPA